jgi:hypothetical protein
VSRPLRGVLVGLAPEQFEIGGVTQVAPWPAPSPSSDCGRGVGFRRFSLAGGAAFCIALVAACTGSSDEQRVRAVISAAEQATESRDTSDAMALVADDYSDSQGFDKEQLRNFLRAYFLTHPKIELFMRVGTIEFPAVDLARIRVEMTMLGTRGVEERSESIAGENETLRVELQLRDSEWRVTRVDRVAK